MTAKNLPNSAKRKHQNLKNLVRELTKNIEDKMLKNFPRLNHKVLHFLPWVSAEKRRGFRAENANESREKERGSVGRERREPKNYQIALNPLISFLIKTIN